MRHFLSLKDFSADEILEIIDLAIEIKTKHYKQRTSLLKDQKLAMIFEKSSTRTRVSFEVGMYELGGTALFLSSNDTQLGRGEPIKDTARTISSMVDLVMIRTFGQERLEEFAKFSKVPVINALTDSFHPMQILADFLTIKELKKDKDLSLAWIGDGNNMANSWVLLASILGKKFSIASPKGYEIKQEIKDLASKFASKSGASISYFNEPSLAIKDANVVSTDVWASMGDENEQEQRLKDFANFGVNADLMSLAQKDAIFLHCLPAHRGEEVTEDVFEAHANTIFKEAENRLHAQKAVMVWLDRHK